VIEVRMRHEDGLRPHERPRAAPQIEHQLQFGDAPVRLDSGPRISFNRKALVNQGPDRQILDHVAVLSEIPVRGKEAMKKVGIIELLECSHLAPRDE
jgi:hypothetical protein